MAFIYIENNQLDIAKSSGCYRVFSSTKKMARFTGYNVAKFYEHFGRQKNKTFVTDTYKIIKCKIE